MAVTHIGLAADASRQATIYSKWLECGQPEATRKEFIGGHE
jgi:hypothetical protein